MARQTAIGDQLRALRRKKGMSLAKLGEAVGCSRQFISDLELGLRSTSDAEVWIRLSRALEGESGDLVEKAWRARGTLLFPAPSRMGITVDEMVRALRKKQGRSAQVRRNTDD